MKIPVEPPASDEPRSWITPSSHPGDENQTGDRPRSANPHSSRNDPNGQSRRPSATSARQGQVRRTLRLAPVNFAALLMICIVALLWWASGKLPRPAAGNGNEPESDYSSPLKNGPLPLVTVMNERTAALGLPVNLEGTVVAYPEAVGALVGADGGFRTDLSLSALATLLEVDPRTIARKGATTEIDPDAALFTVVTGRLSEPAKAHSRRLRAIEASQGRAPSGVVHGWLLNEMRFCLNALARPSLEQRPVLGAIRDSARGIPRRPGAKFNAISSAQLRDADQRKAFKFEAGNLPLEPFPTDRPAPPPVDQ